jgi:hypothetical protein
VKKLIFTAIALVATSAFALDTGTLNISGTVSAVNDISISPSSYTTLNITGGESNKVVAVASETSNNLLGYKINMKSANASKLLNSSDATKFTTYKVRYNGGSALDLTTSYQTVKTVSSLSGLTTNSSNIAVDVVAYPTAPAGTYSDTITVAIVAN